MKCGGERSTVGGVQRDYVPGFHSTLSQCAGHSSDVQNQRAICSYRPCSAVDEGRPVEIVTID